MGADQEYLVVFALGSANNDKKQRNLGRIAFFSLEERRANDALHRRYKRRKKKREPARPATTFLLCSPTLAKAAGHQVWIETCLLVSSSSPKEEGQMKKALQRKVTSRLVLRGLRGAFSEFVEQRSHYLPTTTSPPSLSPAIFIAQKKRK